MLIKGAYRLFHLSLSLRKQFIHHFMQPILYVFDIDGTLTDSVLTYHKVITDAMINIGIPDIDTNFDNYLHHTDSYALEYNYERCHAKKAPLTLRDTLDIVLQKEMANHPPVKEILGAKALLQKLHDLHIPIAFGTGAFPMATHVKMTDAGLSYNPEVLATSKTSITREGFVLQAIEKAKKTYQMEHFERIVAVGDGLWDLKTAQNLKLDFVGIGEVNKEVLLQNGCTEWRPNLTDFPIAQ